jgi:hypothetical protein
MRRRVHITDCLEQRRLQGNVTSSSVWKFESNRTVDSPFCSERGRNDGDILRNSPFVLLRAYDDEASDSFPPGRYSLLFSLHVAGAFLLFTLLNGAIHRAGRC